MSRSAKDRPDVRLFSEIGVIAQQTRTVMERGLPEGLSYASFTLLGHFAMHGGEETPARLAEIFQVTKGAITNTLQRLAGRGLVAIRGDQDDGRRKHVRLTPEGLAAYEASLVGMRPVMVSLRQRFGEDDFEAALPFLTALRAWLEENR
jgi:DNA-binding MarR family transcriptional regulator